MENVKIRPINRAIAKFRVVGTSAIITHAWSEKARAMMRDKQAGKKTKAREVRDPQGETQAACYRTRDGRLGISGMALKNAIISAAHKDLGIEKTLVRKAIFLVTDDPDKVLPFVDQEVPTMREDMVRVGMGSSDLRYRPQWDEWAVDVELEVDADLLQIDDVLVLIDRAGFGVGIGEWRPEKDGEFGRFRVDRDHGVVMESVPLDR